MEKYVSNSHRSKKQQDISEKKVEKVVNGKVQVKKKSEIRKFTDIFFADDVESVKRYIVNDVLIPTAKKAISDIVNAFLYGGSNNPKKDSTASKVAYGNFYDNSRTVGNKYGSGYNFYDIKLDNRGEAEEVLYRMDELIETYGLASVADFYELVGITGRYTDNKYGWTDIQSASIVPVRDGYMIRMPKAIPLDL